MPSAGELLRTERLKRNCALAEIANLTCISTRYLEAIESNDTRTLPGDFFHRSFIRQYASALGLEEAETRRILDAVEPTPEIDPIPVMSVPLQIAEVEQSAKPLAQIPTRVAAILLLVVLGGCSGLYAIWHRAQESADMPPAIAESAAPASQPNEAKPPVSTVPAVSDPAAPAADAVATTTDTQAVPVDSGKITVDLAATETTWVSLSAQGRTLFSGILDASQTKNFAVPENAKLLTGNAAGLDVRMNGRPLGPLGPRGQVRVILFSQDNFRIVSPNKM